MSKYDKLKINHIKQTQQENENYKLASNGLDEIIRDTKRTVEIYNNAEKHLDDIDERFEKATELNKTDVCFLLLATALQIGRWIILGTLKRLVTSKMNESRLKHDDDIIEKQEKKLRNKYKEKHIEDKPIKGNHRDWASIIFDSVPYDITRGSNINFGINMEGANHRIHTLGHDPILGWLFGTLNILSDTITLDATYQFQTFKVEMMNQPKRWISKSTLIHVIYDAIDSIREDENRLPAAVFAQALHFGSDVFTKLGLPIPILETFVPNIACNIYKSDYDTLKLMKDIAFINIEAVVALLINMLIASIHNLFYNEKNYPQHELFEVKTRKIIMYSNIIASTSNVISVESGVLTPDYLDLGGYLVTMYRIVTDIEFIQRVKKEFLENEWQKLVIGDEYKFITGEEIK